MYMSVYMYMYMLLISGLRWLGVAQSDRNQTNSEVHHEVSAGGLSKCSSGMQHLSVMLDPVKPNS